MELEKCQTDWDTPSAEKNKVRAYERLVSVDPWADLDAGQERRDNWMLSYIDILTLILTLFVLLLALQPKHEVPVSGQVPEFAELSSLTLAEQNTVKALVDDAMETKRITALFGTPFQDDKLQLLAEPKVDEVAGGIEPPILGGAIGSLASAASKPFIQSKQLSESRIGDMTVDPRTWPIAAPAKRLGRPAKHQSTARAERPRASATDIILAELNNHRFFGQVRVSHVAAGVQLEVSDNLLFAEGSAQLILEGQKMLGDLAQVLRKHQGLVSVEGHTDSKPISSTQFPSNWELSSSRATNVTRHLISHGLDPTKLRAVGYADTRPVGTNATNEGRTRNRRVSLVLEAAQDQ